MSDDEEWFTEERWYTDTFIVSENPFEDAHKYILEHKDEMPFLLVKASNIKQIRISKEDYKRTPKSIKKLLKENADKNTEYSGTEWDDRHRRDFYWGYCSAYVFTIDLRKSIELQTQCEFGYEGIERSIDLIFLDSSIPELIRNNLGIDENRDKPTWLKDGDV